MFQQQATDVLDTSYISPKALCMQTVDYTFSLLNQGIVGLNYTNTILIRLCTSHQIPKQNSETLCSSTILGPLVTSAPNSPNIIHRTSESQVCFENCILSVFSVSSWNRRHSQRPPVNRERSRQIITGVAGLCCMVPDSMLIPMPVPLRQHRALTVGSWTCVCMKLPVIVQ